MPLKLTQNVILQLHYLYAIHNLRFVMMSDDCDDNRVDVISELNERVSLAKSGENLFFEV